MKGFQSINEEVIKGFERIAENYPDKTAIIYLGEKFSYAKLKDLIYRFANALHELGIRDNDRVAIYLPNCPQWVVAYFGIQKIGGVPVPLAPIYTPYEIKYMLNDCGAKMIVCQDTNYGYVREVLPETCLTKIIVSNIADLLPWYKKIIGKMFDRIPHGVVTRSPEVFSFGYLAEKYSPTPMEVEIDPREHLACIFYTGGTTGFPKGVPSTHAGMVSYIMDLYDAIENIVSDGDEVLVLVNPLFHIMGKGTFIGMGLSLGNPTVVMPHPLIDAILDAIQTYKATLFLGCPHFSG